MNLWKSIIEAIESITSNKLRSALTMLGIVIGVASVIVMLAIGNGTEQSIVGEIEGIGTNLLFITSGGDEDVSNPKPLTLSDDEAMGDPFQAPSVANVSATIQGPGEITFGGESTSTSVVGATPDYAVVQNTNLAEGEFINDTHLNGLSSVVLLGTDVAKALFDRTEGLVGETVRIEGQPFRVIGVLEEQGGSGFGSADDQVLIPLPTAQVRIHHRSTRDQVDIITIQAANSDVVTQAQEEVTQILRTRHQISIGDADDFSIISQQSFLDLASTITGVLTVFPGGVAGISLLVGGIGIMNIMLVSVIERTKEIGLRKALGARKMDILTQFLTESSILSLVGGFLGILLGWGISILVGMLAAGSGTPINPVISLDSVLLTTVFSAAVGIFFGLYPANRAANLQPVEALRFE